MLPILPRKEYHNAGNQLKMGKNKKAGEKTAQKTPPVSSKMCTFE